MKVQFTLTGLTPLLMSNDDLDGAEVVKSWRDDQANKNQFVPGDDRTPPWVWHYRVYSDGNVVAMPSENIMVALRSAGTQMTLKKQKTCKEISQSGQFIETEFCDFTVNGKQIPCSSINDMRDMPFAKQCEAAEKLGFKLFVKRCKPQSAKGRHIRVRPRFNQWEVQGVMNVVSPELTMERLTDMFNIAGRGGLCDWRPSEPKPGPFGMFEAKLKKVG